MVHKIFIIFIHILFDISLICWVSFRCASTGSVWPILSVLDADCRMWWVRVSPCLRLARLLHHHASVTNVCAPVFSLVPSPASHSPHGARPGSVIRNSGSWSQHMSQNIHAPVASQSSSDICRADQHVPSDQCLDIQWVRGGLLAAGDDTLRRRHHERRNCQASLLHLEVNWNGRKIHKAVILLVKVRL